MILLCPSLTKSYTRYSTILPEPVSGLVTTSVTWSTTLALIQVSTIFLVCQDFCKSTVRVQHLTPLSALSGLNYLKILKQPCWKLDFHLCTRCPRLYASGREQFLFPVILCFKQNIPFLYQLSSCSQVGKSNTTNNTCFFFSPEHFSLISKGANRESYQHMKERSCNTCIIPTAGLVYSFYTHVTATQANKNVNWTNRRRKCFNLFVKTMKKWKCFYLGNTYTKIQMEDFV